MQTYELTTGKAHATVVKINAPGYIAYNLVLWSDISYQRIECVSLKYMIDVLKLYGWGEFAKYVKLAESGPVGPDHYTKQIPGLETKVKNPVTGKMGTLKETIINLNDIAKFSKKQISEWLFTLDENPVLGRKGDDVNCIE